MIGWALSIGLIDLHWTHVTFKQKTLCLIHVTGSYISGHWEKEIRSRDRTARVTQIVTESRWRVHVMRRIRSGGAGPVGVGVKISHRLGVEPDAVVTLCADRACWLPLSSAEAGLTRTGIEATGLEVRRLVEPTCRRGASGHGSIALPWRVGWHPSCVRPAMASRMGTRAVFSALHRRRTRPADVAERPAHKSRTVCPCCAPRWRQHSTRVPCEAAETIDDSPDART
jgi:hypothetical protein